MKNITQNKWVVPAVLFALSPLSQAIAAVQTQTCANDSSRTCMVGSITAVANVKGQIDAMTLPTGAQLDAEFYDGGGQKNLKLDNNATLLIDNVTVDSNGGIGAFELQGQQAGSPDGQVSFGYDGAGRLINQGVTVRSSGGSTLGNYQTSNLVFDNRSNVRAYDRSYGGTATTTAFDYTGQNQLQSFEVQSGGSSLSAQYNYDSAGNLGDRNITDTLSHLKLEDGNYYEEYTSQNRVDNADYKYDSIGRLTQDEDYCYKYTKQSHLQAVLLRDGKPCTAPRLELVAHYSYDGSGNRVRQATASGVTYAFRDSVGSVVSEIAVTPTGEKQSRDHISYAGQRVAVKETDLQTNQVNYRYTFNDQLGSQAANWNDDGVIKTQQYSPYGKAMSVNNQPDGAYEFTGHEQDNTGNIYMRARHYDPDAGRFQVPDFVRDFDPYKPSSYNLYEYVGNNPANMVDPSGLCGGPDPEDLFCQHVDGLDTSLPSDAYWQPGDPVAPGQRIPVSRDVFNGLRGASGEQLSVLRDMYNAGQWNPYVRGGSNPTVTTEVLDFDFGQVFWTGVGLSQYYDAELPWYFAPWTDTAEVFSYGLTDVLGYGDIGRWAVKKVTGFDGNAVKSGVIAGREDVYFAGVAVGTAIGFKDRILRTLMKPINKARLAHLKHTQPFSVTIKSAELIPATVKVHSGLLSSVAKPASAAMPGMLSRVRRAFRAFWRNL